ncbi:MAG: hypothetical protein ACE5L7_06685 [Candidatus Aminicenantales bacterium]
MTGPILHLRGHGKNDANHLGRRWPSVSCIWYDVQDFRFDINMIPSRTDRKFSKILKEARKPDNTISYDPEKDGYVLFSDHHKGDASAADDFQKNAPLYDIALSYYQKKGFRLIVLGDNEELWENRYDEILPHYKDLIEKEISMAPESNEGKKIRVWGNHDKEVSLRRFRRYCRSHHIHALDSVQHREGICLGDGIFLIHGHQGRFFDDKAWRVSRWAVKIVWKTIQKIFRIGIDGPAENFHISDDLELKYYRWARKNRVLLICGHTHRAIFGSLTHFDRLQIEIKSLKRRLEKADGRDREKLEREIERKSHQVERILNRRLGMSPKSFSRKPGWPVPCYFNDGCCGYTNGITCIELEKDAIRLIKWQRQTQKRIVLVEGRISLLIIYIKERRPIDEQLEPSLKEYPLG